MRIQLMLLLLASALGIFALFCWSGGEAPAAPGGSPDSSHDQPSASSQGRAQDLPPARFPAEDPQDLEGTRTGAHPTAQGTAAKERVNLTVVDVRGLPVDGAVVLTRSDHGTGRYATDRNGRALIDGDGLSTAYVSAAGLAAAEVDLRSRDTSDITVRLQVGTQLVIVVRGQNGVALPQHPVMLVYEGHEKGVKTRHSARTGKDGVATFGELVLGPYGVHTLPWQCHLSAALHEVEAGPRAIATLEVPEAEIDSYTEGAIDIPAGKRVCMDGLVTDFAIEAQNVNDRIPIHEDGRFWVFGASGEIVQVRLLRRTGSDWSVVASSAPWTPIVIGARPIRLPSPFQ